MFGEKGLIPRKEYLVAVTAHMVEKYCIDIEDTGYTDDEWLLRFGDLDVGDAVEKFAEKYGLTPRF